MTTLNPEMLRHILNQGCKALEANVEYINALNVFPVPDGDTGTNMLLTMKAMENEVASIANINSSELIATMARGALFGARGNSGVILAQFFQGLSRGLADKVVFDSKTLASALSVATTAAYKSVGNPIEGTILTVMREISEAAQKQTVEKSDILKLWEVICNAAKESLARTPSLLPVLRQAGVVDAGGQGLCVILEGSLKELKGEDPETIELSIPEIDQNWTNISEAFLEATDDELYGYCTQFLLLGNTIDIDTMRDQMQYLATSTVVIGTDTMARVHVHTTDPGPVLSYAITFGTISQVSIVNMDEQHQEFASARRKEHQIQPIGLLAICSGQGLIDIFMDYGASAVLSGGDTMNPSTKEILDASEKIMAERIIVLPNNHNIILAAEQASLLSPKPMEVIKSESIPQGISALMSYNPEQDFEINVTTMNQSALTVLSGAICVAQRDIEISGVKATKGQIIGLLERELVASGNDSTIVLIALVQKSEPGDGSLITLYWGANTAEEEALEVANIIRSNFKSVEVEVAFGGQPHYNYLVSVE